VRVHTNDQSWNAIPSQVEVARGQEQEESLTFGSKGSGRPAKSDNRAVSEQSLTTLIIGIQTLAGRVAIQRTILTFITGRLGSLEAVPVDTQLSYFGFKCLPGNAQLNGGAGWTPNHAFGSPECGFEHFSFVHGKISHERNRRHG
jgi:hypothetical protein